MAKHARWRDEFDSPWKLDKEFQQIIRRAKVGKGRADKLFKVWLRDGSEHWLLIHIEVQGTHDPTFPERMFRYNVAAYAMYNRQVVSLAVLCDQDPNWRPCAFSYGRWGSRTGIEFLVAKLLDYLGDKPALESSSNPFAAVVLAHGEALATQGDPPTRRQLKVRLVKGLYERGWAEDDVRELFRLVDWIMALPDDLEEAFRGEIFAFEQEKQMPYLSSIERLAIKRGLEQGLEQGLERGLEQGLQRGTERGREEELRDMIAYLLEDKFGDRGRKLLPRVRKIHDVAALRALSRTLMKAATLDEVRAQLPPAPQTKGRPR